MNLITLASGLLSLKLIFVMAELSLSSSINTCHNEIKNCETNDVEELESDENGIWIITETTFDLAFELQSDIFIKFYLPSASSRENFDLIHKNLAIKLGDHNPPIKTGKIDALIHWRIAERYDIKNFPSFKYFSKKTPVSYKGIKTVDSMYSWIMKLQYPAVSIFEYPEDLPSFIQSKRLSVVLLDEENSFEAGIIRDLSKSFKDITFIIGTSEDYLDDFQDNSDLILFKNYGKTVIDYDDEFDIQIIKNFLYEKMYSLVSFNYEVAKKVFKENEPILFLFGEKTEENLKIFKELAEKFGQHFFICPEDLNYEGFESLAKYLHVSKDERPFALIVDTRANYSKYKLSGDFNIKNLENFVNDWLLGNKLSNLVISEPIPDEPFDNEVRIVVAENFWDVVFDLTKHVFVYYYTDDCENCLNFYEDYSNLAKKLKNYDKIVLAKINCSKNEVREMLNFYPAVKLYPAIYKNSVDYLGKLELDKVLIFIDEKANLELYKKSYSDSEHPLEYSIY